MISIFAFHWKYLPFKLNYKHYIYSRPLSLSTYFYRHRIVHTKHFLIFFESENTYSLNSLLILLLPLSSLVYASSKIWYLFEVLPNQRVHWNSEIYLILVRKEKLWERCFGMLIVVFMHPYVLSLYVQIFVLLHIFNASF